MPKRTRLRRILDYDLIARISISDHSTMKWIALFGFILLLIPPVLWQWSREIMFVCQMFVGVATVYLWSLAWFKKSGKSPSFPLFVFALGVIIVWITTLCFPVVYVGQTSTFGVSVGAFHLHAFLDDGQQVKAVAASAFTSGSIAPYTNQQSVMKIPGGWGVLRSFVFSCSRPLVMDIAYSWEFAYLRIRVPMWTLVVVSIIPGMLISIGNRMSARRNPLYCKCCSYNLTGNFTGICPECGTPIPKAVQKEITSEAQAGS